MAFEELKKRIVSAPVLVLPNDRQPFQIKSDSSNFASGRVLQQLSEDDGKWHPVAFLSKSLTPVEQNYDVHDKELLAIVRLSGASSNGATSSKARATRLRYGQTTRIWNISGPPRTSTGGKRDGPFTFPASTIPSITTWDPQWANWMHSLVERNKGVVLLDPSVFQIHALRATLVRGQEVDILRDIRECMEEEGTTEEPVAVAAQRLRRAKAMGQVHKTEWDETDGLLTFNGRIYVPDSKDLRQRIIVQYHNSRVAGHPGCMKTLELISRDYWWPQIGRHVGSFTRTCEECLRNKVICHCPIGELNPIRPPEGRWEQISVDFIVELPDSHGFDAIMVVVDSVTKRPSLHPD